jgi:ribosome maturation factor RimP
MVERRGTEQTSEELARALEPVVSRAGLELVDVELKPSLARVVVDRPGGVDVESIAELTPEVSRVLDRHDPFPGARYTLEVTSPGLERPLRTAAHFERAVGEVVSVRTTRPDPKERRMKGRLVAADAEGIVLALDEASGRTERIAYREVSSARTVFEWGSS